MDARFSSAVVSMEVRVASCCWSSVRHRKILSYDLNIGPGRTDSKLKLHTVIHVMVTGNAVETSASPNEIIGSTNVASEVADLIGRCPTLPSLPSAYLRLVEAMNDPYSAGEDFARIIEEDAGLTARVLKLVNSSMYGVSPKVDSVSRALSILGVQPLHDLVLATSAVSAFDKLPADLVEMESFWRHSLGTAVVSRMIAVKRKDKNVEALFVCGLLHDIGRLVMYLGNPKGTRKAHAHAAQSGRLLHSIEHDEFGYDHAMVGSALLEQWGLPTSLSEPVKAHHQPALAGEFASQAATVHVADIIAHAMMFGTSGEPLVPSLADAAWKAVDGDEWFHQDLLVDVEHQFQTAVHGILN